MVEGQIGNLPGPNTPFDPTTADLILIHVHPPYCMCVFPLHHAYGPFQQYLLYTVLVSVSIFYRRIACTIKGTITCVNFVFGCPHIPIDDTTAKHLRNLVLYQLYTCVLRMYIRLYVCM